MRGVFVTGTDTGVGKTVVSAALMARSQHARYWKPIQTGPDDDTSEVVRLARCSRDRVHLHGVRLPDPVSPHLAAERVQTRIDLPVLTDPVKDSTGPWVVEGAGGVLVPINESDLMVHLMARLGLPVVVVARSTLGTINHTLLTLEALRKRNLRTVGVFMVGEPHPDNRAAIARYGEVAVSQVPWFRPLTPEALAAWQGEVFEGLG
jgi:dethiobiotin synthase